MTITLLWLLRFAHVLAASVWLGGYLALLLGFIPLLKRHTAPLLEQAAYRTVRIATYAGTATLFFGLLLVGRTRGYAAFGQGEWGIIVATCLGIAIAVLGIGDGALKPALRRLSATGNARRATAWTLAGLGLLSVAYLLMTKALYAASNEVERDEFYHFAKGFVKRDPSICALSFVACVEGEQLKEFEQQIAAEYPGYRVVQRGADGKMVPVSTREEYFPSVFVEPLGVNRKALGYDLGSETARRQTLLRSRDSGEPQAVVVNLVIDRGDTKGLLLFDPIPENENETGKLQGFALGVFDVSKIGEQIQQEANRMSLQVQHVRDAVQVSNNVTESRITLK